MTLMSVAERRTPCSDGPLYGVGSGVVGGAVAPRRHKRASRGWRNRPTQMDY